MDLMVKSSAAVLAQWELAVANDMWCPRAFPNQLRRMMALKILSWSFFYFKIKIHEQKNKGGWLLAAPSQAHVL